MQALIRVGIGGWSFAPWRGSFYPPGLPVKQELHFASRKVTAIEVNGTFDRTQTPASFAHWAAETPEDFIFAIKAARGATYKTDPAEREGSTQRFLQSGLAQLGSKLGPILWQFPKTRRFDAAAMAVFLRALPPALGGSRLRHVVDAGYASFEDPAWFTLLREHNVAAALVEDASATPIEITADFVYARLKRNAANAPEGYAKATLDQWSERLSGWAKGKPGAALDCFVFFIAGDKERAPDAAQALLKRLT